MNTRNWLWLVLIAGAVLTACQRDESRVSEELEDLKQAQKESPQVAKELRKDLEQKKAEVAQLETKVALADRGVTDRVVEERNQLKDAVKRQEQEVNREVQEAKGAADVQNTDAERARRELEATRGPGKVESEVKTEHTVTPNESEVEVQKQRHNIPVETTRTVEQRTTEQKPAAPQPAAPQPAPANP